MIIILSNSGLFRNCYLPVTVYNARDSITFVILFIGESYTSSAIFLVNIVSSNITFIIRTFAFHSNWLKERTLCYLEYLQFSNLNDASCIIEQRKRKRNVYIRKLQHPYIYMHLSLQEQWVRPGIRQTNMLILVTPGWETWVGERLNRLNNCNKQNNNLEKNEHSVQKSLYICQLWDLQP